MMPRRERLFGKGAPVGAIYRHGRFDMFSVQNFAEREKILLTFVAVYAIIYGQSNTERYRRGHNGADSKSVCVQAHVGSNPTRSEYKKGRAAPLFVFGTGLSESTPGSSSIWLC